MKFFSPKYPQFILGIFLCFTFFFAMPVSNVKAEGECRTDPPPVAPGMKLAKILVNDGSVGQDEKRTPAGGKTCYVPIASSATSVHWQDLLDANVASASWKSETYRYKFLSCTENNGVWYNMSEKRNPQQIEIDGSVDCAVRDVSGNFQLWRGRPYSAFTLRINDSTVPDYKKFKPSWGLSNGVFLFFMGFEEGSKNAQDTLTACKDAMAQAKDNKQEPCYKPNPAVDGDPKKFFELTKQMPLECKLVFEKCNLGDTPADPNASDPRYGKPPGYEGPLPDCAFSYNGCRSINDVLQFLVNIGQQVFKYIGTFAFVMFIYGGFTMILSMGSAEKVKKGQEILTAAVVGIIISFGAYLLIDFILDALQVGQDFRSIGALEKSDEIPGTSSKK